jgi:putative transposase
MPAPLFRDLRDRIVRAVEGGSSIRQAALRFEVCPSAVVKLMRRFHQSGSRTPTRFGGPCRPIIEPHKALVWAVLDTKTGVSLVEIQAELRQHGIMVAETSTISSRGMIPGSIGAILSLEWRGRYRPSSP